VAEVICKRDGTMRKRDSFMFVLWFAKIRSGEFMSDVGRQDLCVGGMRKDGLSLLSFCVRWIRWDPTGFRYYFGK